MSLRTKRQPVAGRVVGKAWASVIEVRAWWICRDEVETSICRGVVEVTFVCGLMLEIKLKLVGEGLFGAS